VPIERFDQPPDTELIAEHPTEITVETTLSAPAQFPNVLTDKYEYISLIGRGGLASVFKARHKLTGRIDAIKVLHKQEEQHNLKRFEREASTIAQLSDPNIVAMYDFGVSDDIAYLTMEYVSGESLAEMLRRNGALDEETFLSIFSQICSGLDHAHKNGVVHRDLKPGNILITRKDGQYIAKIADFGIAKWTEKESAQDLTHTGETLGTPLYMSPEQSMGRHADALSDLYSLGCVMYESFTLEPPIVGQNLLETVHRRLNEKPKSFAERGLSIWPNLDYVVQRCLEREPRDRIQTAADVGLALSAGKDKIPASAKPHVPEKIKQFKIKVILFSLIMLIFVGVMVPTFHKLGEASKKATENNFYQPPDMSNSPTVPGMEKISFMAEIESGPAGKNNRSMAFYTAESGLSTQDFHSLQQNGRVFTSISSWKAWYQSLFTKLTYAVEIPKTVRCKINVNVTRDHQVVANVEWQDPSTDPKTEVFIQKLLKSILELKGSPQLQFPENVDAVNFNVYASGLNNSMRLNSSGHPLTTSQSPTP